MSDAAEGGAGPTGLDDEAARAGSGDAPPRASVLMPTYNDGRFIRQAIHSILAQTFGDFELVIVNDGSTDDTARTLLEYARRDKRIRVLTNERNLGVFASLNRGLEVCRGEYVVRMDADDITIEERLEKQLAVMDAQPDIVALGGALTYIDAGGQDLNVTRRCAVGGSLLRQSPLLHPTVVFRRKVVQEHAIRYRGRFRGAEDYFFWLELSRFGRLSAIDDVVLNYRISAGAARMRHLKRMLWDTVQAKACGLLKLGIRPRFVDVVCFLAECLLLLVPSCLIRWYYIRKTFGRKTKVEL